MKAYEATFTKDGADSEVMLVGANTMSGAAKKAEEHEEAGGLELIKLEVTDKVIL